VQLAVAVEEAAVDSVSRTFLYANPDARALVSDAISKTGTQYTRGSDDQEPSWRKRAFNAEAALKTAQAEITAQRRRMAILLGQIRDLEHDLSPEAAQRLATENTTLKQRGPPAHLREQDSGRSAGSRPLQQPLHQPAHRPARSPAHRAHSSRGAALKAPAAWSRSSHSP
jgi:hypothetical protein